MSASRSERRIRALPASVQSAQASNVSRSSGAAISRHDREAANGASLEPQLQLDLGTAFSTDTVDFLAGQAHASSGRPWSVDVTSEWSTLQDLRDDSEQPSSVDRHLSDPVADEDSAYLEDLMDTDLTNWPIYDSSNGSWVSSESVNICDLPQLPPISTAGLPRSFQSGASASTSRGLGPMFTSAFTDASSRSSSDPCPPVAATSLGSNGGRSVRRCASFLAAGTSSARYGGPSHVQAHSRHGETDRERPEHSSPLPVTATRRSKRRRSTSNSTEQSGSASHGPLRRITTRIPSSVEAQGLVAPHESLAISSANTSSRSFDDTSRSSTSESRRTSASHPGQGPVDMRFPSFSLDLPSLPSRDHAGPSNLSRYIDNLLSSEQASQYTANTSLRDLLLPPSPPPATSEIAQRPPIVRQTSTSFSTHRGSDAGLSLGHLPRFHFNADFEDGMISPLTSLTQPAGSSISTGSRTGPRRPNLQRNTTAVSPPEESPLNSPVDDMRIDRQATPSRDETLLAHREPSFFTARNRLPSPARANWHQSVPQATRADHLLDDLEHTRIIMDAMSRYEQETATQRAESSSPASAGGEPLPALANVLNWADSRESAASGEISRAQADLWGEVSDSSAAISGNILAGNSRPNEAIPSRIPTLRRRPGSLGRGSLRGPTRGSNEAWMRAQGIDFYDTVSSRQRTVSQPSTHDSSSAVAGSTTARSVTSSSSRSIPTLRRVPRRPFYTPAASATQAVPSTGQLVNNAANTDASVETLADRQSRRESEIWQHLQEIRQSLDQDTQRATQSALPALPVPWRDPSSSMSAFDSQGAGSDTLADVNNRLRDIRSRLDSLTSTQRRARAQLDNLSTQAPRPPWTQRGARSRTTLTTDSSRLSSTPDSIRAPPAITLPRPRSQTSRLGRLLANHDSPGFASTGPASPAQHSVRRPVLQPFEEIYAEVEAEFANRDRTRPTGGRPLSRHRTRREGVMQDLLADLDTFVGTSGAAPRRSRESLASDSTLDLPDRFGFWDHREELLSRDALLFDPHLDLSADTDDDRVPLPPFLLRSLRARRQATFGQRGTGIAGEADNYLDDLELDLSYEGLLALSERIGEVKNKGASEAALQAGLKRFTFAATSAMTSANSAESRCGICLEDYAVGDDCASSKACGHGMHYICLETWLKRNHTCPICRGAAV